MPVCRPATASQETPLKPRFLSRKRDSPSPVSQNQRFCPSIKLDRNAKTLHNRHMPTDSPNEQEDLEIKRDSLGRFIPGQIVRPQGRSNAPGGRTRCLMTLDSMLRKEGNQKRLQEALQEDFEKNPVRFFKQIIMPLLPQNVKLDVQTNGDIQWLSLSNITPTRPSERSTAPVIDVSEQSVVDGDGERPKPSPEKSSTGPGEK